MNRKRLISILAGMTLSLATFAGPAVALEATDPLLEDSESIELAGLATVTVETEDSTTATVESDSGSVTLDPAADEPVDTSSSDDGQTGGDDPVTTVENTLSGGDGEPESGGGDPAIDTNTGGGDVRSADDNTSPAPSPAPAADDRRSFAASLDPQAYQYFGFASQRPAPAASAVPGPEVAESAEELAPLVAPARSGDESQPIDLAAATPINDPVTAPTPLKIFASLLLAGTAMSWWNAREAAEAKTH